MKTVLILALAVCAPIAIAKPVSRAKPKATPAPERFGGAFYIPSGSMEPTLPLGARVFASPLPYQNDDPVRGDIVLLQLPLPLVSPGTGKGTTIFVKRIVAIPGDRVEMRKRVLWVNGHAQKEPFVLWREQSPLRGAYNDSYDMKVVGGLVYMREYNLQGIPGDWTFNFVRASEEEQLAISRAKTEALPRHKFLALGDHRSNSNDSHVFGLIDRSQIKSKVTMRVFPWPHVF